MRVRPKKHFGQHFLTNTGIAHKIANGLDCNASQNVLEIGPGTGKLTREILKLPCTLQAVELDTESIEYLIENNILPQEKIFQEDFLRMDFTQIFKDEQFSIIGNFPYNISSQIVFKIIENRHYIPFMTGMFQRELARRICSPEGSKEYGIISVITQAFYTAEYNFTVHEKEFNPPPKVKSGVITLRRKKELYLDCDESLFITVVKTAFNQRRKTLSNSLKKLLNGQKLHNNFGSLRPEQLHVSEFIYLTNYIHSLAKE
ncbi:MAG: 16S rRNA (adenine(1518)-N(6)/adenine(1519)-N(6))-dimethyltransferase RsmA [Bacteroidota bacterium]